MWKADITLKTDEIISLGVSSNKARIMSTSTLDTLLHHIEDYYDLEQVIEIHIYQGER